MATTRPEELAAEIHRALKASDAAARSRDWTGFALYRAYIDHLHDERNAYLKQGDEVWVFAGEGWHRDEHGNLCALPYDIGGWYRGRSTDGYHLVEQRRRRVHSKGPDGHDVVEERQGWEVVASVVRMGSGLRPVGTPVICPKDADHGPMQPRQPATKEQVFCIEGGGAWWECQHYGCRTAVLQPGQVLK